MGPPCPAMARGSLRQSFACCALGGLEGLRRWGWWQGILRGAAKTSMKRLLCAFCFGGGEVLNILQPGSFVFFGGGVVENPRRAKGRKCLLSLEMVPQNPCCLIQEQAVKRQRACRMSSHASIGCPRSQKGAADGKLAVWSGLVRATCQPSFNRGFKPRTNPKITDSGPSEQRSNLWLVNFRKRLQEDTQAVALVFAPADLCEICGGYALLGFHVCSQRTSKASAPISNIRTKRCLFGRSSVSFGGVPAGFPFTRHKNPGFKSKTPSHQSKVTNLPGYLKGCFTD